MIDDNEGYILVLYSSKHGATKQLAHLIARGIEQTGVVAKIRTVPDITSVTLPTQPAIPAAGDLYCTLDDLAQCSGLALGSGTYFGNMAGNLKYFIDQTVGVWMSAQLQNKPACVFTSSGSYHGGQESTLLSMMLPLLHHGMMMIGVPYSVSQLNSTCTGGTPYGASHVSGNQHQNTLSDDEKKIAIAQGERLAKLVKQLAK